jgi:hypothetical protein
MSCHGTGEIPSGVMVPPSGQNPARWFQNIKSGQPFDPGRQSTDYSLQIEVGISNFERHQPVVKAASPQERVLQLRKLQQDSDPRTPRDGAPTH